MNGQQVQLFRASTARILAMRASAFLRSLMLSPRGERGGGGHLTVERPMTAIATSLTGPVAYAIGLIGIAIAGGAMLWGGELTEFGRRACMIGLRGLRSRIRGAQLSSAFGVTAAVI